MHGDLVAEAMRAEMVAVVRKVKHHRVLQQAAVAQQVREPANLVVEMTDYGVISAVNASIVASSRGGPAGRRSMLFR